MINNVHIFNSSSKQFLPRKSVIEIIEKVLLNNKKSGAEVNIIYLDDDEIQELNKQYLNHDYTTDVIAFNLDEVQGDEQLEGEVYIGVDVAKRQATEYGVALKNELLRLAVHGTLHLLGYEDDTPAKKNIMHKLENKFLLLQKQKVKNQITQNK